MNNNARKTTSEETDMGDLVPLFPHTASVVEPEPGTPEPAVPAGVEPAGPVLDGELVDEEEYQRSRTRRVASVVVRQAKAAHQHNATVKAVGRTTVRHVVTVAQGHAAWSKRIGTALTHGVIREQIRLAQINGDADALAAWTDRLRAERDARHTRLRNLPTTMLRGLLAMLIAVTALAGLLVVAGVVFELTPGGLDWSGWWSLLADMAGVFGVAVTVATYAAMYGAAPAWLWAAWREGNRSADAPQWLLSPAQRAGTTGEPVTPSKVVTALRDLGVSTLRKAIKEMRDSGATMLGTIRIAGCGVEVDVALPSGVSTNEVLDKRRKLAENLDRHEHELFITIPEAARTVRLWIAESGALDEPIGPSPLVIDPTLMADLYAGRAPWGQDLRGDAAAIALLQRHLLITGLSNQGKTAALRALVLWLALDVTCEFRIADLKGVGDWRMFDGLAPVLIQGPTDEHVIAATEMLEDAVGEMERRLSALEKSGATDGVTRDMARSGKGFHPIFAVVDEAQQAFMCPAVGDDKRPYGGTKATSRYFMAARKIHNQGRAVNVLLWQGTQDPTDQNLPKMVREGAHIRAALVVGTEQQARMALGDKAVNAGAAPHKLRQGLDKGTLVVAGDGVPLPSGQSSLTIRTHFVSGESASEIANRAKEARARVGRAISAEPELVRELLADMAEVMAGAEKMRSSEALQRLKEQWPDSYAAWSAQVFATALRDSHGVEIRSGRVEGQAGQRYILEDDVLDAMEQM